MKQLKHDNIIYDNISLNIIFTSTNCTSNIAKTRIIINMKTKLGCKNRSC